MPSAAAPSAEILRKIGETVPTPYYLYDEKQMLERVRGLQAAFGWNTGYREYFAVKATPNPVILALLKRAGCGVDCSSLAELVMAERVGFTGDEIMFSSNETPAEEYEYARGLNAVINLDDITHIDYLARHGGIPERICLRLNPGGDFIIGNAVMGRPGDAKFGMTRDQLFEAVSRLKGLGVKSFGLHAFLASNMTDVDYYPTMARLLFETAVELRRAFGVSFFMMNLSGGIGIPYTPEQRPVDISDVGERVRRNFSDAFAPVGMGEGIAVATELGRYVTGPVGWLVTKAIHEKNTYRRYIGVDACAANLMRPAMYGAYHEITVAGKENAPKTEVYDIVGSLCENNDKFAWDRPMPKIETGDTLIIHDAGAHGFSMGYNYNGRLRSAEVLLRADGSFKVIRRAETLDDYFATLDFRQINEV
ncbi:MAG: diaminopimelate decarboxylase [Clostridia bacterium]|nr:diaminopimelate decarboxylase [Clostridia bacterium]